MAKYTGWKKRYSYLDDYQKGMDGKYVYYGKHYLYQGTDAQLRRYKWIQGITDVLLTALLIVGGCLDVGVIWSKWYVLIPYGVEIVAVFLLLWKSVNLILEKNPLKAYLYKKNVPWLKPCGVILTIGAVLSICGCVVSLCLFREQIRLQAWILYVLIKLVMAAGGIFMVKLTGRNSWEPDPSEE